MTFPCDGAVNLSNQTEGPSGPSVSFTSYQPIPESGIVLASNETLGEIPPSTSKGPESPLFDKLLLLLPLPERFRQCSTNFGIPTPDD